MTDPVTTPDTERLRGRCWRECAEELQATVVKLQDDEEALLARLQAAEHRATRAEARAEVRGRAVAIYRKRAEEAEVAARWAHDRAYKADLSWEDEKRRADQAEASRDEWRQTALDERGAALDALEQIKVRDRRIQAVQHLVDQADHAGNWTVTCTHLQRAIDGTNPYRASETA